MENIRIHRHQMASVLTDDDYADADDGRDGGGFSILTLLQSLSAHLCLSPYMSLPLCLSLLSFSLCISLCVSFCFSISLSVSVSLLCVSTPYLSSVFSLSLSVSVCLPVSLSFSF